jgi:hypothetical protein
MRVWCRIVSNVHLLSSKILFCCKFPKSSLSHAATMDILCNLVLRLLSLL